MSDIRLFFGKQALREKNTAVAAENGNEKEQKPEDVGSNAADGDGDEKPRSVAGSFGDKITINKRGMSNTSCADEEKLTEPAQKRRITNELTAVATSEKMNVEVIEIDQTDDGDANAVEDSKPRDPCTFSVIADAFAKIESTTKRLEITDILGDMFKKVLAQNPDDLVPAVYLSCAQVGPAHAGIEIGVGDALIVDCVAATCGLTKAKIRSRFKTIGDLGTVAADLKKVQKSVFGVKPKALLIKDVFTRLKSIASSSAQDKKKQVIMKMLVSSSPQEIQYIVRLILGKLRIGLAEATVIVSLAHALTDFHYLSQKSRFPNEKLLWRPDAETKAKAAEVLKQVLHELPLFDKIISSALKPTSCGCDWFETIRKENSITAGIPVKPMLAKPTTGVTMVLDKFSDCDFTCEYKYDGERAQIHMHTEADGTVKMSVFSRNGENTALKYPDILSMIPETLVNDGEVQVSSFVMDTEAVAYDVKQNTLLPFQVLSTRKKEVKDGDEVLVNVVILAFDLLYLNGESLLNKPLIDRRQLLHERFRTVEGKFQFAVGKDSQNVEEIQAFLEAAIADKCEGLMVKRLTGSDSYYKPSERSVNWLKLKKDYMEGIGDTLDLVPIGAYHGRGKRTGVYGSFLLACYNPDDETFQSITNIGTGFSDEDLTSVLESLKGHIVEEKPSEYMVSEIKPPDVWFAPHCVWEVKAADLSISPKYFAALGLADESKGIGLRFPRFISLRSDKRPDDATSAEQIFEIFCNQANVMGDDNG